MTIDDKPSPKEQDQIDRSLLDRISENQDRQALTQLYEYYRHPVGSFLSSKLREKKLIEEVFNDVMLVVWRKASSFQGKSKVSTWIFGIAYRTCLSHAKKESKHTDQIQDDMLNDVADSTESDLSQTLRASMTELSDDHRTVIELAYYFGHSITEISEIIDCPSSTVKTRLFYARQHLKKCIENHIGPVNKSAVTTSI